MYQAVLHLSLLSTILVLLQKCTYSHLYLSIDSMKWIPEIVVYILLRLYLLLASVSSGTASITLLRIYLLLASVSSYTASINVIDNLGFPAKMYIFTTVLINCFKELYCWEGFLHSTAFIPAISICMKLYWIYHLNRSSCFSGKSVHVHTCTYQRIGELSTFYCVYTWC